MFKLDFSMLLNKQAISKREIIQLDSQSIIHCANIEISVFKENCSFRFDSIRKNHLIPDT